MLWIILAIIISYLIGSIPTAYLFVRFLKGTDIRKHGSGNVGATNAMRLLGKPTGITVLLLDIAKGFVCVFLVGNLLVRWAPALTNEAARILCGLVCIMGHNWTIFLQFKGGKGVASTLGVLCALSVKLPGVWIVFCLVLLTWLLVFVISRIVSLSSIVALLALPAYLAIFKHSPTLLVLGILLAALGLLRHKTNLKRILQGTEPRLTLKKSR